MCGMFSEKLLLPRTVSIGRLPCSEELMNKSSFELPGIIRAGVLLGFLSFLPAQPVFGECGRNRPCGPEGMKGPLARLIPQGFAGADFKPACRRHDRCYATYGSDKKACDRRFLSDMQTACSGSRRPLLCRTVARVMHFTMATELSLKLFTRGQAKAFLNILD